MVEDILQKVKKLLALSKSDNEHEAQQSLLLAEKLMQKHSITETMLSTSFSAKETEEEIRHWENPLWQSKHSRSAWRNGLAATLASYHACEILNVGGDIHIIGRSSDVQTVRYLFQYCENAIETISKKYAGNGKSWLSNWRLGFVSGIGHTFYKAMKETRNELVQEYGNKAENAIVKIDRRDIETKKWFENYARKIGIGKGKTFGKQSYDSQARHAGFHEGKKLNLNKNPGLPGSNKKLNG